MNYIIKNKLKTSWEDELPFVHYFNNNSFNQIMLSKRAILLYLSKLINLTGFHILVLDNLSKLCSLVYNESTKQLSFRLDNGMELELIVECATIEKLKNSCKNLSL